VSAGAELETMRWVEVPEARDIPLRQGKVIRWGALRVALFNLGEQFRAVENQCPHKAGPLADGIVSGTSVFCPLHNWKISLKTGCVETPAGEGCSVRTFPTKVENGKVYFSAGSGSKS
jgi:nitrite reductase (NADH) small subunit